jgi:hypothetical protein
VRKAVGMLSLRSFELQLRAKAASDLQNKRKNQDFSYGDCPPSNYHVKLGKPSTRSGAKLAPTNTTAFEQQSDPFKIVEVENDDELLVSPLKQSSTSFP